MSKNLVLSYNTFNCWLSIESGYLAALDSLCGGHNYGLLVADLLNLVLTDSGVQNRGNNGVAMVAKELDNKLYNIKRQVSIYHYPLTQSSSTIENNTILVPDRYLSIQVS